MMTLEEIRNEALRLDLKARARLAHELLQSLDELSEAEVERLWAEEAVRRDAQIDAGEAETYVAEEVLREARAKLR